MIISVLIVLTAVFGRVDALKHTEFKYGSENISIFGDTVVIISKNNSEAQNLDDYLRNHVIRIRSPLRDDKFYDFEMSDFIPEGKGRNSRRRRQLKKLLVPVLLALNIKSAVLGPIFTAIAALFAFKGFWAGMTALFVSKAIALKVFSQSKSKCDHDYEHHDDYEDHDQYHDRPHPQKFPRDIPYFRNHEHVSHGENYKPIVIYLNTNGQNEDSGYWFLQPPPDTRDPDLWESWKREEKDLETQICEDLSLDWDEQPWW